jgi:hypothetical protein
VIADVSLASPKDVDAAVQAAHKAFYEGLLFGLFSLSFHNSFFILLQKVRGIARCPLVIAALACSVSLNCWKRIALNWPTLKLSTMAKLSLKP